MMTIQPGEFWVADIPFTDATASKKRPVLVLMHKQYYKSGPTTLNHNSN